MCTHVNIINPSSLYLFLLQQVEEWYPELIEIEEQAKGDASVLLFVIDNQTRAVSSMVEIAYFAGEAS